MKYIYIAIALSGKHYSNYHQQRGTQTDIARGSFPDEHLTDGVDYRLRIMSNNNLHQPIRHAYMSCSFDSLSVCRQPLSGDSCYQL